MTARQLKAFALTPAARSHPFRYRQPGKNDVMPAEPFADGIFQKAYGPVRPEAGHYFIDLLAGHR
jgi:hypothetical protein